MSCVWLSVRIVLTRSAISSTFSPDPVMMRASKCGTVFNNALNTLCSRCSLQEESIQETVSHNVSLRRWRTTYSAVSSSSGVSSTSRTMLCVSKAWILHMACMVRQKCRPWCTSASDLELIKVRWNDIRARNTQKDNIRFLTRTKFEGIDALPVGVGGNTSFSFSVLDMLVGMCKGHAECGRLYQMRYTVADNQSPPLSLWLNSLLKQSNFCGIIFSFEKGVDCAFFGIFS